MSFYVFTADSTYITADSTLFTADADPFAYPVPTPDVLDDFLSKITPWQANPVKARFLATVSANVAPYTDSAAVIAGIPAAYDLDDAVGPQLDVDGLWVGVSRMIPTPAPNTLFSLDTNGLGFDQGYVDGPYDSAQGLTALPDEDYRRLLYAKILANSWDGTSDGAIAILRAYFRDTTTVVFVQDDAQAIPYVPEDPPMFAFDLDGHGFDESVVWDPFLYPGQPPEAATITYAIVLSGRIPSAIDLYVLGSDLLPVKAISADVSYAVTTIDGAPVFGFDMEDDHVSGFDVGAIDADPFTVAALTAS